MYFIGVDQWGRGNNRSPNKKIPEQENLFASSLSRFLGSPMPRVRLWLAASSPKNSTPAVSLQSSNQNL